LQICVLPKT